MPTLDGEPVTLKVPPGTSPSRKFRLRGRGVERKGRTGDLLVSVEVVVPTELDDEQRAAIQTVEQVLDLEPRRGLVADDGAARDDGRRRRKHEQEASS